MTSKEKSVVYEKPNENRKVFERSTADLWNLACLFVSLICCLLVLVGRSLRIDILTSVGTRIMIVFQFFCVFLVELFINGTKKLKKEYMLFLTLFVVFILCGLIYLTKLLQDYVLFFCTLMFPAYLLSFYRIKHVNQAKNAIYVFAFIVALLFIYLYFSPYSHIFYAEYGIVNISALTLGFPNPNEAGIYAMVLAFIFLSSFFENKDFIIRALSLMLVGIFTYMTFLTESRTCFILLLVTVVAYAFNLVKRINENLILVAFILPIISFIIFLIFPDALRSLIVLGESADTGRSYIYEEVLNEVNIGTFFFGNFGTYLNENFHNSYVSLFMSFGLFGTIAYLVYVKHMYSAYYVKLRKSKKPNYVAFAGALCIIVHGVSESAFLTSGVAYALLGSLLLVLSLPTEVKE